MSNAVENVSVGKPKIGGAVYRAPAGTTLPTDASTALAAAFTNLGYCSDAGVVNSNSMKTAEIKAWGGDIVATPVEQHPDAFKFVLIESKNPDVLKAVYGSDNVTGALATGIVVNANSKVRDKGVWAIDMELSENTKKRVVIPDGQVTTVGDITYVDNDVVGYEITISALPDSSGNTHYEYIVGATTTGTT
jgi:hypothetical protein